MVAAKVVSDGRNAVYVWADEVGARRAVGRHVRRVVLGAAPRQLASEEYASCLGGAAKVVCETS